MKKFFLPVTLLLPLICWTNLANAEPPSSPQYQIEMIIFETTALRGWTEEYWPWPDALKQPETPPETPEIALEAQDTDFAEETTDQETIEKNASLKKGGDPLLSPDTIAAHTPEEPEQTTWSLTDMLNGIPPVNAPFWISRITPVPQEALLLTAAAEKLVPEKGYRIITHLAWRQPAITQQIARPLAIEAATTQGDLLTGNVMFYKNRFAHVVVELQLERIIPAKIREAFAKHEGLTLEQLPESWPFYLKASRKVKSGPWYYIDHPLFGILLTIQKVKASDQENPE